MEVKGFDELFVPVAPTQTRRYDEGKKTKPSFMSVAAQQFSSMAPYVQASLPASWYTCQHPEGNKYFVRHAGPRVVTDVTADALTKISNLLTVFEDAVNEKGLNLPETAELFLYLTDDEKAEYYLVDHSTRVVFWLHTVNSVDFCDIPAASDSHLKLALERMYWLHVEYFPCHEAHGRDMLIPELTNVFLASLTDRLTSSTSTVSFSNEECREFVHILKSLSRTDDAYATWVAARLWSLLIYSQRFLNYYGQEACRLEYHVPVVDRPAKATTWMFKALSVFLFRIPEQYNESLDKIWVDETANVHQWRRFLTPAWNEWKFCLRIGFTHLITALVITTWGGNTTTYARVFLVFSNATVLISMWLLWEYRDMLDCIAEKVSNHLSLACDEHTGFQWLSVKFALPMALLLWSFGAYVAYMSSLFFGEYYTVLALAVLVSALGIYKTCLICYPQVLELLAHTRRRIRLSDDAPSSCEV